MTEIGDSASSSDLRHSSAFAALLLGSYQRLVGQPLVDARAAGSSTADWLYADASFCLLAHNTDQDPRFIYANRAAQARFGYDWQEFTTLPSRLSAETPDRAERQRLLEAVTRNGFIDDYSGIRVAKSGARFRIERAVVWNLIDVQGNHHGQAAVFERCSPL